MRTIHAALILNLMAASPLFAQEVTSADLMDPVKVVKEAKPVRLSFRARLRQSFRQAMRETAAEYARSRSLELEVHERIADSHVATGAVVGAALAAMTTANGCGSDFHECPTAKYVVAGAGAGAIVAIIARLYSPGAIP
jgi:hypothetical protein